MNVFNRVVMILLIVLGFALAAVLVTFQWDVIATAVRTNLDGFTKALYNDRVWLLFLGAVAAWAVLMIVLFILEVRRPRHKAVRIKTANGGRGQLGIDSVVQSLQYRIDELAGVHQVQPRIVSHGKDVAVTIDLDTSPSVNVPALTDQIVGLSRDVIEGQLGVKIRGKVEVNVKHEPYPSGTMPPAGSGRDAAVPPMPPSAERRTPAPLAPSPFAASVPGLGSAATRPVTDAKAPDSSSSSQSR